MTGAVIVSALICKMIPVKLSKMLFAWLKKRPATDFQFLLCQKHHNQEIECQILDYMYTMYFTPFSHRGSQKQQHVGLHDLFKLHV